LRFVIYVPECKDIARLLYVKNVLLPKVVLLVFFLSVFVKGNYNRDI